MPVVIAQSAVSRALAASPAGDAYAYRYDRAGLAVGLIRRADQAIALRIEVPGGAVTLTPLDVPTGGTVSLAGDTLTVTIGTAVLTFQVQEVGMALRLKYALVLNQRPASNDARWSIATEGGATFAVPVGGTAEVRDAGGALRYTQPAPTAVDSAGTAIPIAASYAAGTLTYAITYPTQGGRYPVTIDPTTASTSTSATATAYAQRRLLHVASDGTAIALYYDGSNWQWRTASSPYTSWSSATAVTNATRATELASVIDGSDHVHVAYKKAGGPDLAYRKLTFASGSWSPGAETVIASGDFGIATEYLSTAIDVDGRIWVYTFRYIGSESAEIYYSANGTSWTNSLTPATNGSGSAAAVIARAGDYIVMIRCSGGTLFWRRANTNGSVGAWSSESSKASVGIWNDHQIVALADVNGRLVLAAQPNNTTDYAIRTISYQPGTDTWDTSTADIGTAAADRNPALARIGDDVYCVWSEFSASNSYAIVYKAWTASSATWGSKTTLVAAGANRLHVNAGGTASVLGVLWTAGTASPYDVVFDSVAFVTFQTAAPVSDVSAGSWTTDTGATSNLYAAIDESVASDADYLQSSRSPAVADVAKVRLAPLTDPAVGTNHAVRYRYRKSATAGDRIDLTVTLYAADGTTVVATQTVTDIDAVTTGSFTLTPTEADAIPSADYATGLVLGFSALKV